MNRKTLFTFTLALATIGTSKVSFADVIASEDFDGGAVNLTSSNVPTLDGGGGDTFAVGATAAWPTTGGTPFSLTDNSTSDVGDTTAFTGDTEGIYGANSNFNNMFLGLADSDEFGKDQTASWTFDISGATDLGLSIGLGAMEGSTFSYAADSLLEFSVAIDGGTSVALITVAADASGDGYSYRALDDGIVVVADTNALAATGPNGVTKILSDSGLAADDTFLDKTPATGPGAGILDQFTTSITGTGAQLVLTLRANLPFEAAAIDNIQITGTVPEPASGTIALIGSLLVAAFVRRR